MATPNPRRIQENGGLGHWTICRGRFEVWDRGDGTADITPTDPNAVVTSAMGLSCQLPVGTDLWHQIGHVSADDQPDQGESGQLEMKPAFPGVLHMAQSRVQAPVATVGALEALLASSYV